MKTSDFEYEVAFSFMTDDEPLAAQIADQLRDSENIHIHTYDWLLDQLRGALAFSGPSRLNPYLIQTEVDKLRKTQLRVLLA